MSTLLWWHYVIAFFLSGLIALPIAIIAYPAVTKILLSKSKAGIFWVFLVADTLIVIATIWLVFSIAEHFKFLSNFGLLLAVSIPHALNAIAKNRMASALAAVVGAVAAYFLMMTN
jgi:hypothetical protein